MVEYWCGVFQYVLLLAVVVLIITQWLMYYFYFRLAKEAAIIGE